MNIRPEDNVKMKDGATVHADKMGDDCFFCKEGKKHAFADVVAINSVAVGAVMVDDKVDEAEEAPKEEKPKAAAKKAAKKKAEVVEENKED